MNSRRVQADGLAPYGEPDSRRSDSRALIDLKADGSFRHGHELFQLLPGPDDDRRAKFDELFGGPPREPEAADRRSARWTSPLHPGRHRRNHAADRRATSHAQTGHEQPGHGRRRRAQLRGERARSCARAPSRTSGFSRRQAMRAARSARRCSCGINSSIGRGPSMASTTTRRRHCWGPLFATRRSQPSSIEWERAIDVTTAKTSSSR